MRVPAPLTLAAASLRPDNNFNLIRLLAAWAVIYGHSHALAVWGGVDLAIRLTNFKFSGGIAVDVFFVISGFLIAASMERNSPRGFLVARALRIFPALLVCVSLSAFVLGPLLTTTHDYWRHTEVWHYFIANAGLSENTAYFLPGVFRNLNFESVNGSLWSLPIEVRLYVAIAAIGVLALNRKERFNLLFVIAMAIGFLLVSPRSMPEVESQAYYCVAFFFAGAFAWINRDAIPLSWPLLFAVMIFAAALLSTNRFFVGYFLVVSYGTLFLAYVPRLPVIRHHDFSYGLYLYGWPSQQLVQTFAPTSGPIGNTIGGTLLAAAFAVASWFLVEAPAMRLKSRFRIRPRAGSDDASTLALVAAEAHAVPTESVDTEHGRNAS
ncbi:MAG TPA: acyltransferase [Xanthomonadaceae bacterium]|nr:acyltransferase [Xanthomonadaceae bacterium]